MTSAADDPTSVVAGETQRDVSLLAAASALAAPPLVVLVLPTITLLTSNAEYFPSGWRAGIALYVAGGVLLLVGVLLHVLRHRRGVWLAELIYLLTAPAWLVVSLVGGLGVGRGAGWSVAVVLLIAVAVAIRRRPQRTVIGALGVAGATLVGMLGAEAGLALRSTAAAGEVVADDDEPEAVNEALPNIYHLILDEFQTDVFEHVLDDDLRARLGGFTWFHEAITSWGRTGTALAAMVSLGPYDYEEPLLTWTTRVFDDPDAALHRLADAGYHMTGYLPHPRLYGRDQPFPWDVAYRLPEVAGADASLSGQAPLAVGLWAYVHLPRPIARAFIPEHQFEQLEAGVLLPDEVPVISVRAMRRMIAAEPDLPPRGRYLLVHLIHPHFPHVTDAACRSRRGTITGAAEQARCATRLIDELVDVLDELGRLDDSVVVIHADHGARYAVEGGELVGVQDGGHYSEAFTVARARSLLLVKPPGSPGQERSPLAMSDRPATIEDVYPTIFDEVGIDAAFGDDRASLLGDDFPERPERWYHFYESDTRAVNDGPVHRFRYRAGRAELDAIIDVPSP